jgi:hypothetical protein
MALIKSAMGSNGGAFSDAVIQAVWEKGRPAQGYDPRSVRVDRYGSPIARDQHGKKTPLGWEVDHITAVANGGTDHLSNLQPLQWETNRRKSDKR